MPQLTSLCADSGVAVIFLPELPGTGVSGATSWLSSNKALIQLSLRYKSDDHLWFTFFHEAYHILKHGRKKVFLEFDGNRGREENEANEFAANKLIRKESLAQFVQVDDFRRSAIKRFATQMGISPGIVVGRLQHDGILLYNHHNDLKRWFQLQQT